jgi:D-3-phosphoglycerate dehydrogenase
LQDINRILSDYNIEKQICDSKGPIGYLMADVVTQSEEDAGKIYRAITNISENVVTRVLY